MRNNTGANATYTLSTEYKEALRAMKDQASIAGKMLPLLDGPPVDNSALRSELKEVHQRISQHSRECSRIVKLLMASDDAALTIETLDEQRLADILHGRDVYMPASQDTSSLPCAPKND